MRKLLSAIALILSVALPAGAQYIQPGGNDGGTTFTGGTITDQMAITPADNGTPLYLTSQSADTADGLTVIGGVARAAYFARSTAGSSHIVGIYAPSGDTGDLIYGVNNVTNVFRVTTTGGLIGAGSLSFGGTVASPYVNLYGDAANQLAMRNGTTGQELRIYNTFTSSTNYEAACFKWDTSTFYLGACKGSSGSLRTTLITGSTIAFVGGASGGTDVSVEDNVLIPAGNNGVALGKTNQNWSNLFLGTALVFGNNSTKLVEDASGVLANKNGNDDTQIRTYATNGGYYEVGTISELITLSTVGATTDSSADLLPANALLDAVGCRVTTTITTATNWSVGDATTAARFSSANATLTAGTTSVGMNHMQASVATDAAGPVQTSAAKLRITTTGTPGAGAIRCTTFYRTFVAPTS